MFACICLDSDAETSLVVLQGGAVSLGDERFELLEYGVSVVLPV